MTLTPEHPRISAFLARAREIILNHAAQSGIDLILLVGSLARGEFTAYLRPGKLLSYSDIELLILTKSGGLRDQVGLRRKLSAELLQDFVDNGFAKIGFWVMPTKTFWRRNALFFVEARAQGVPLFCAHHNWRHTSAMGRPNPVDLREICLHRAINMIVALKKHSDTTADTQNKTRNLNYSISRNYLDLLTVFCYSRGLQLHTYRDRLRWLSLNGLDEASPFSPSFRADVELATAHKLDPINIKISAAPMERLGRFVAELRALSLMLLELRLPYAHRGGRSGLNYHGTRLFAFKLMQAAREHDRYSFRHALIDHKRELLQEVLDELTTVAQGDNSVEHMRVATLMDRFGLRGFFPDALSVLYAAALFHYPYLNKESPRP